LCTLLCNIVSQKGMNFATSNCFVKSFDLLRRKKEMRFKHQTVQFSCKHSLLWTLFLFMYILCGTLYVKFIQPKIFSLLYFRFVFVYVVPYILCSTDGTVYVKFRQPKIFSLPYFRCIFMLFVNCMAFIFLYV